MVFSTLTPVFASQPTDILDASDTGTHDIAEARARIITLSNINGENITLSNGGPRTFTPREGQRLTGGNQVATGEETFAHLQMDTASTLQMNEQSRIQVSSAGRQLTLTLQSGNALMHVVYQEDGYTIECRIGAIGLAVRGTMFTMGRDCSDIVTIVMLSGYGEVLTASSNEAIHLPAGSMMWVFDDIHAPEDIYDRALETRFYNLYQGHDITVSHAAVIGQLLPDKMTPFTLYAIWNNQDYLLESNAITCDLLTQVGYLLGYVLPKYTSTPTEPTPEPTSYPTPSPINTPSPTPVVTPTPPTPPTPPIPPATQGAISIYVHHAAGAVAEVSYIFLHETHAVEKEESNLP